MPASILGGVVTDEFEESIESTWFAKRRHKAPKMSWRVKALADAALSPLAFNHLSWGRR